MTPGLLEFLVTGTLVIMWLLFARVRSILPAILFAAQALFACLPAHVLESRVFNEYRVGEFDLAYTLSGCICRSQWALD